MKYMALHILLSMEKYFADFEEPELIEIIRYQERKILDAKNRYAVQIRDRFREDYVKKGIRLAEKYLEDESGELRDYKVFCFNGVPKFVQVDIGRFTKHIRNYYDIDWNLMPMTDYVGNDATLEVARPRSFGRMLEIATSLAEPFQFVRVDFYEVSGKPYVGEMTFFHEGGSIVLIPDEWNTVVGDYWKLSE